MKKNLPLIGILFIAAAWKFILNSMGALPFNADEAVVGLMARHILEGERPIFFYGQAYMGSLDAYLTAGAFAIFGAQVWVIRLMQGILFLLTIITTVSLGRIGFESKKTGLMAGVLLALPAVNVTLYTTVSLGGYGEALLLGSLSMLIGFHLNNLLDRSKSVSGTNPVNGLPFVALLIFFGFLTGVGIWANALSLLFTLPTLAAVVWKFRDITYRDIRKSLPIFAILFVLGLIIGGLPLLSYIYKTGWARWLQEFFGSAVAVETGSFISRLGAHLFNFFVLGIPAALGFRPPWEVRWLVLPALPFVLLFWSAAAILVGSRLKKIQPVPLFSWSLLGSMMLLATGFFFTSFGVDPSGRYFLPLALPLAFLAAWSVQRMIRREALQWLVLAGLAGYQGLGTWQSMVRNPPGLTTQFDAITQIDHTYDQSLIEFLRTSGETRGYSNYWVSYPLAFLSNESIVFSPRLPYHPDLRYTSRDNRYLPYDSLVNSSRRVAYITTKNPILDNRIRASFIKKGVTWKEQIIGDFHVFYSLSGLVRVEEIDLAPLTGPV